MLTGIVLTHNSEQTIGDCLDSLKFCDQLVVIDDSSTDSTLKIVKSKNVTILQHDLSGNFAAQRNWALSQVKSDWVLFVDSDEVVPTALASEITNQLLAPKADAFSLPRVDFIWGKTLTHGDLLNARFIRLAKPSAGVWINTVHEHWQISGKVEILANPLFHYPHKTIAGFLHKLNNYSSIRAQEFRKKNRHVSIVEIVFAPIYKFFVLYVLKLGFMDGTAGFIHAMLMSFYVFLVAGKTLFLQRHD